MENLHKSVMINEIISFLPLTKSINVIDATFGGGGYSKTILEKYNVNQLLAIDRDPISKIWTRGKLCYNQKEQNSERLIKEGLSLIHI